MPDKTIKHGNDLYRWNIEKEQFEKVFIRTEPLAMEDVPREVIQETLEFLSGGLEPAENKTNALEA